MSETKRLLFGPSNSSSEYIAIGEGRGALGEEKSNVTQSILDSINGEQVIAENRIRIDELGGVDGLVNMLEVDVKTGLTYAQAAKMLEKFGDNSFVESPMESYFTLLIGALSDPTLIILIAAATVSLIIGILTDPESGYIEGTAIFMAVFLVSNIAAGNDYSKQLQFRALEESSAKDDRISVFRESHLERINPANLVVGDVIVMQVYLYLCCCCFTY